MSPPAIVELDEVIERRYFGLARLARGVSVASDFGQLASAVSAAFEARFDDTPPPTARLWAVTSGEVQELARHPADADMPAVSQEDLRRAAGLDEVTEVGTSQMLVGLQSGGVGLGVLEIGQDEVDFELLAHAAPVVACALGLLAGQGAGDVLLAPFSVRGASDVGSLMSTFAAEAKRLLDHDRLSAYLLTNDGRAFERFAVATSPIAPGEGVIIPFEDVGLRHVVITNRALVSSDIASDPRIVGREDRVVARAGFHGLISVPLRLNGRPFGVLNFVSRAPGFYREEDIPIAEQIGDQVAGFVGNLRVQERMRTLIRHEAVETERTRLARELYHAVAQSSVGIDAVAEALEQRLTGSDEWACRQAARVRRLLREELGEVRRAVADLGPRGLDSHTLTKAMEAAVSSSGAQGVTPRLALEGDPAGLSSAVVKATYRIFQEALGNVRQHAEASKVEVELRIDERDLLLRVHDNGVGFDPDDLGESSGLGLPFMRERALALGGMLNVESAPLSGTTVTFELFGARGAAEARVHDEPVELATAVMLRVFVVERHALLRTGLVALIGRADDMRVVGEAATLEETRGQVRRLSPDAVLVDSSLGDAEVERTIADIRATVPSCRVLVLSEYGTHDVDFIAAGASGVVPKSLRPEELADAVRAVATGGRVASFPHSAGEAGSAGISERERAILALMTTGRTNAEIGSTLFLATKTVERQVATVVRKLNARNRAHAVAIAVARHIVEAPSDDA